MLVQTKFLTVKSAFSLVFYIGLLLAIYSVMPEDSHKIWEHHLVVLVGVLGIWRYSWWFLNFLRARIFASLVFPRWRKKVTQIWKSGWRPEHIYFVIASYKEDKETTENLLKAMLRECRAMGVPATLFLGASAQDEYIVRDYVEQHAKHVDFQVVAVRQTLPDKRIALGQCLRSMSRHGVIPNTPVILMDGDVIMGEGCLKDCTPFFHLFPNMHALTTHEAAVFNGPKWMENMTELRFAQRHLMMQSHSLSKRVMTLTGRLSMFRSQSITHPSFINQLENDYLHHWLWGTFRFLSGDDKSTWFLLLKAKREMLYIPDVMVYTVEYVEGNGIQRSFQNLMRWSGNMLRNNGRAIQLGPLTVPPFIWWCLVDQRIVIWTALVSPVAAIMMTVSVGWVFVPTYLLWLGCSRLFLAMILFGYSKKVNMSYPFLLYILQVVSAGIKVFMLFHLPRQRWSNRATITGSYVFTPVKRVMGFSVMLLYIGLFLLLVGTYAGHLPVPSFIDVQMFIRGLPVNF